MPDSSAKSSPEAPTRRTAQRPRDAATLVIVDQSAGEPRVLMGRRHADQVFLPGMYVFPGGRVDRADHHVQAADSLNPADAHNLLLDMKGSASASRARALALAAIRETFEEAGLIVGAPSPAAEAAAGATGPWKPFLEAGYLPRIGHLAFFARAITPPGRTRRYDTRFFAVEASAIAGRVEVQDGELEDLEWFTFAGVRALNLPGITRVVVEDLQERLSLGLNERPGAPIPFYFHRNGTFERALLSHNPAAP